MAPSTAPPTSFTHLSQVMLMTARTDEYAHRATVKTTAEKRTYPNEVANDAKLPGMPKSGYDSSDNLSTKNDSHVRCYQPDSGAQNPGPEAPKREQRYRCRKYEV